MGGRESTEILEEQPGSEDASSAMSAKGIFYAFSACRTVPIAANNVCLYLDVKVSSAQPLTHTKK